MKSSDFPKQGEVWLVDFNRHKQKEIIKIRPALVMSNNFQNEFDKQVIVALITSEEEELVEVDAFEVVTEASLKNGLERKSKILLNRLQTIYKKSRLIKFLGEIENNTWEKVLSALWVVFKAEN